MCNRKIEEQRAIPQKSYCNPLKSRSLSFLDEIKRKKLLSTTEDKSYGEISCFENKKLDL